MTHDQPEVSRPPNAALIRMRFLPLVVFALAAAFVAYPPIRGQQTDAAEKSAFQDSTVTAFRYFAVDAFYYLGVAERSADAEMYTFDGEHRTNGFHPLWQIVLTYGFRIFDLVGSQESQIRFAFGLGILFTAIGCGFVAMTAFRLTRSVPLSLLAVAPGPYYILTRLHGMGLQYGSMWSCINGMESPLTILFFGMTLVFLAARFESGGRFSRWDCVILGLLGALMTLARLDDVFIFLALLVLVLAFGEDQKRSERFARVGLLLAPPAVLVGGYILFNLATMGIPMPVSGIGKSGFALFLNLRNTLQMFTPFDMLLDSPGEYVDATWRAMQTCLPAALALMVLVPGIMRARAHGSATLLTMSPAGKLLFITGIYVVIKALYNFINVKFVHQGHWYYPAAVIYANVLMVVALGRIRDACIRQDLPAGRNRLVPVLVILFALFSTVQFSNMKRADPYQINLYQLWKAGPEIAAALREKYDGRGFIEFDDGIISYATRIPAMSGLGFTLDLEGFEAKERGELLELAYERGYRVFVSHQYYERIPPAAFKDPGKLRNALRNYWVLRNTALTRAENLDLWDFNLAAVYKGNPQLLFIGFSPRAAGESVPGTRRPDPE